MKPLRDEVRLCKDILNRHEELQEKLEKVKDFRPIDDVFFEVLAQNIGVCQEILRVILEDDDLMSCFLKKEVKNPKFPKLSAEVTRLKETEGGAQTVCEVMEKYENLAIKNANIQKIMRMIEKEYSKEEILDIGYTEEEFFEAEKKMVQLV